MNLTEARTWLAYEPDTGQFTWKRSPNRRKPIGSQAGSVWNRRVYICIDGKRYLAHRVAWLLVHNSWPDGEIDHINGDPADNRIVNLRIVSRAVNMQNLRAPRRNSKTGFLGVFLEPKSRRNPYVASIVIDGRQTILGRFNNARAAHEVYVEAKRLHHPGNTL